MRVRIFLSLIFAVLQLYPLSTFALNMIEGEQRLRMREERRDGLDVYRHNLNYFVSGQPDTKVQLSFKVRMLHNFNIYGAYTQTMFWDLFTRDSSPFSDLNYNPELFHRSYLDYGILKGIDAGVEHRSNGRAGEDSRSWNRAYVAARTEFKTFGIESQWNTKAFYFFDLDSTNRDIPTQLGFLETSFVLRNIFSQWLDEAQFDITLIPGGSIELRDIRGSREIGFRFRLPIKDFNPFLYFQLYSGFNESLLFYKENRTTYRVGFAI